MSCSFILFFFFKQKTAYEMRISDWSSDVCSSDLELAANTIVMAAALLPAGIDPEKSILFNQARVAAHAELCWILQGTARVGWLNRMTQWKDKAGKNRDGQSVGLFTYPVLMAADVLVYKTTHVPVGEDQKQHLEFARDVAAKFKIGRAHV